MSSRKSSYLTFDWWVIEKRQIYLLLLGVLAAVAIIGAGIFVMRHGLPFGGTSAQVSKGGARFVFFEGEVRVLRAATRESVPVTSETEVFAGDTLQTQGDGRARLTMADGSTLIVRENSTVLIRDNAGAAGQNANVKVAVDRGQINVRTEDATRGKNIVETPKTASALAAQTNTSFRVNADQSEEIRVTSGQLQTTTRDGQKTTLTAGEYVAVTPSGVVARRESLLAAPKLSSPDDAAQFYLMPTGNAPPVTLRWGRTSGAVNYRLEIASSPFFVQPSITFERDAVTELSLTPSVLAAGTYFWRVRANGANQNSEWSEAFKFSLMPPAQANRAVLGDLQATLVGGRIYLLTGRARPGTTVRCLGRETLAIREQTWELQVTAPAGARALRVTAQEAQGPVSSYEVALP